MALISFTSIQNGTSPEASQVNNPLTTIYNEFNGNITAANLASNAVTTPKLADASVTNAKVDFGGSGAGIWWEEIGRTTLGSAGDIITVSSLPVRKYLMVVGIFVNSGQISPSIRFNNDSGTNYSVRSSNNGAADSTATSQTSGQFRAATADAEQFSVGEIHNIASRDKIMYFRSSKLAASAAGTPDRSEGAVFWDNSSDAITRVDAVNGGTGDFGIGSELIILGHN